MSRNEVTVHVNRGASDTLEADTSAFETRDSFTLLLRGHETPAHVHCRLDGDGAFSRLVSIDGPNYYVEPDDAIPVPIAVEAADIEEPIEGELEVLTGYGSESVTIDVIVKPKPAAVEIDESLAKPKASSSDSPADGSPIARVLERVAAGAPEPGTLAVVGLGLLAIAIATSTAATIGGSAAMIGLVIVVVGVAVALFLLVR